MQNHTKVYMNFFNYAEQDFIMCEMCQQDKAVDIHHLNSRKMGGVGSNRIRGTKKTDLDYIENLMGLCRDCHNKAESNDDSFNMYCRIKHLENVCNQIFGLIEYEKRYENRKQIN